MTWKNGPKDPIFRPLRPETFFLNYAQYYPRYHWLLRYVYHCSGIMPHAVINGRNKLTREISLNPKTSNLLLNKLVATRATKLNFGWLFFVLESHLCSYLKRFSFDQYQFLHKNTTWNSLHICANRRSLDQIEDFWWFFVHCKFLTRIFTAASGHLTHKMLLKWWPVSLFSICMTKIVPDSDAWRAQMLTRCNFQSDSPMLP